MPVPFHTQDVVERLGLLLPCIDEQDTPAQPAELADWIEVGPEDEPETGTTQRTR